MIEELKKYEGKKIKVFLAMGAIGGTLKKLTANGLVISDEHGEGFAPYASVLYVQAHADSKIVQPKKGIIKP